MSGDTPIWSPSPNHPLMLSESPVVHLLSCEACPTLSDSRRVQEVIAEAKHHLGSLQLAIGRAQEALRQLKDSRSQLDTYIKAHEAVIAPIRRVPDDVLIEIFTYCLPSGHEAAPDPMAAPLLLARVCQRWRRVTTSTPTLWSTVYLVVEPFSVEQSIKAARLWMSASGQCSLDITLRSHDTGPCLLVLEHLLPHAHRWRNASFSIPYRSLSVFNAIRGELFSLESLSIDIDDCPSSDNVATVDHFNLAPRLTAVDHGTRLSPSSLILPWKQLTSYTGYMNASEMLMLFKSAYHLIEADIVFKENDGQVLSLGASTGILESLKSLRLVVDERRSLQVLPLLPSCVALRELNFHAPFLGGNTLPHSNLDIFLRKSGGRLEKLWLNCAEIKDSHLLACLQHTPSLMDLKIRDGSSRAFTENLMKRLTRNGSDYLLPRLRYLFLSGDLDLSDRTLIPMIQSRWRNELTLGHEVISSNYGSLECLVLDYSYGFSTLTPVLLARLQSLKHNGYLIRVQTCGIDIRKYDILHSPPFVHS
ncbi:hypothetical protein AX15_004755 [Amanita polypyramis BW_CC]|nr:hypothetical protein AX15_004755 [Amanita polypyramis BW_CC]